MVEDIHQLDELLKGVDPEQAVKLRSQFEKMLIVNQTNAARQSSYRNIRTLVELEQYENERLNHMQIKISDTQSYLEPPEEPQIPTSELEDHPPRIDKHIADPMQSEGFQRQKLQALMELRRQKDWANSKLFRTVVVNLVEGMHDDQDSNANNQNIEEEKQIIEEPFNFPLTSSEIEYILQLIKAKLANSETPEEAKKMD